MTSLFIAPLDQFRGCDDSSIINALFSKSNVENENIFGVKFTKSKNAVTLQFCDRLMAENAKAFLLNQFPHLTVKMDDIASFPSQSVPLRFDDAGLPDGLQFIPHWVSEEQQREIMTELDGKVWDTTIKRRVQHYGFQFKYSQLNVDSESPVSDVPPACKRIILERPEIAPFDFNQLTVNEYVAGVGIASHCDTHSAFIDTIAVVSLLAPITMDFVGHDNERKVSVQIPPRSLMLMSGESRYGWRHSVAKRKTDIDTDGVSVIPRERRVSLTFRRIVSVDCKCHFPSLCDSQGADALRPRRMQEG